MTLRQRKVCIVTPLQHGGGAEYQIGCLIDYMASLRTYDVHYVVRHADNAIPIRNYTLTRIGQSGQVPKLGYLMDARVLTRALDWIAPDVIYQRVGCGYTGVCGYYARRRKVPLVWHVAHDSDVTPGSRFYGRHPVRRFLEKSSIEYGIRHASHIVTQTRDQAVLLERNYGRQATAVIANFQPAPDEEVDKSGPATVIWIANLKPWKRPELFVRLATELRGLEGVQFVMIGEPASGSGDREWSAELMQSIAKTPNLNFLGKRSQREVNQMLAKAHVFVNTSLQEGFPNTFIQAWMRRVPVVSLGVNPDGVLDGARIGFPSVTFEGMVESVRKLLTDQRQYNEMAERARTFAMENHSMRNAAVLAGLLGTGMVNVSDQISQGIA